MFPKTVRAFGKLATLVAVGLSFTSTPAQAGSATANLTVSASIAQNCIIATATLPFGAYDDFVLSQSVKATSIPRQAEEMRARRIGVVARRFYDELPAALTARSEPRSNLSARERASQRWKRTIH